MHWHPFSRQKSTGDVLGRRLAELQHAAKFYPIPLSVVRGMREFAEAYPEDVVYDLDSGDAPPLTLAAQEFGRGTRGSWLPLLDVRIGSIEASHGAVDAIHAVHSPSSANA